MDSYFFEYSSSHTIAVDRPRPRFFITGLKFVSHEQLKGEIQTHSESLFT